MNVSLSQTTPSYALQKAIMLYGGSHQSIDLVTLHDVKQTTEGPIVMAGTAATKSALRNLLDSVADRVKQPLRLLHQDIIAISDETLVWWVPAQSQRIAFSCKELGKRAAVVPQPPLMFVVNMGEWYVFALAENTRPTDKTALFIAPYFNVWDGGHICTGSTSLPKGDARWNPDAWTTAFFKSAFTHPNNQSNDLVVYEHGPFAFWRDMLNGKFKAYPMQTLVKTKQTVKDLLSGCQKGGRHA